MIPISRKSIHVLSTLFLGFVLSAAPAYSGRNDKPAGAGEARIDEVGKKVVWQKAPLNNDGDVDWYWFQLEKPITLALAFQKPAHREFYSHLYSEANQSEPLAEVKTGNTDEPFPGYTLRDLDPGKYYLRVSGAGGDYSRNDTEMYLFALSEQPPPKNGGSNEKQDVDQEPPEGQPTPPPEEEKDEEKPRPSKPEEQEMNQEDVERLLDAMLSEEEDQRAEQMEKQRGRMPEVLKDW